jgi:hypothetical protein
VREVGNSPLSNYSRPDSKSEDFVTKLDARSSTAQQNRSARLASIGIAIVVASIGIDAQAERVPFDVKLADRNFEQIAREKGVTVYQHKDSDIIRLGAEARLPASPEVVQEVLLDYAAQKGRIGRVTESRVLSRSDEKRQIFVYQHLNLPVISDRDFTLQVDWGKDGVVRFIDYRAVKKKGPKQRKGIVRVSLHEGSWQLKPLSGGRSTFVRFMVMIDMAGWLPKWLARSGSGDEVPKMFMQIRKMVVERKRGKN